MQPKAELARARAPLRAVIAQACRGIFPASRPPCAAICCRRPPACRALFGIDLARRSKARWRNPTGRRTRRRCPRPPGCRRATPAPPASRSWRSPACRGSPSPDRSAGSAMPCSASTRVGPQERSPSGGNFIDAAKARGVGDRIHHRRDHRRGAEIERPARHLEAPDRDAHDRRLAGERDRGDAAHARSRSSGSRAACRASPRRSRRAPGTPRPAGRGWPTRR